MNLNKKARALMVKYPNGIIVKQLIREIPNEEERRQVFSRMVYFAQEEENAKIFGPNLIDGNK